MPELSDRQLVLESLVTGYCLARSTECAMEEVDDDIDSSSGRSAAIRKFIC
ncbi:hypothetical protein LIPSTDRAFT_128404 [Lipomyces starkeyi NRRL Y-11557]|uniref:Uncharacterized protein n=1 Tax=Lipomyces starkeyi NRRL Y-11557 TaxID=675824 RepID=A0A1E3QEY5_LIPST|nr:hypothetical protein LIPSTDRAFT_230493 [Lipomyces starkeyi NRRL Y-11557]ODQ76271.1 hypothetical protein LIPSTDRAFT_128404 [Lipomyces starkeyi NRRL Y-11557]